MKYEASYRNIYVSIIIVDIDRYIISLIYRRPKNISTGQSKWMQTILQYSSLGHDALQIRICIGDLTYDEYYKMLFLVRIDLINIVFIELIFFHHKKWIH